MRKALFTRPIFKLRFHIAQHLQKMKLYIFFHTMEQHISYIFIYYRGCLEKGVAIFMPLEPIYNKNFYFNDQICLL
jgi:hypothetical protein